MTQKSLQKVADILENPFAAANGKAKAKKREKMMSSADVTSCWSKPLLAPAAAAIAQYSESMKPSTKVAAPTCTHSDGDEEEDGLENMPLIMSVLSYISYTLLVVIGYFRELLVILRPDHSSVVQGVAEKNRQGYAPLFASFESFYTRNIFRRLKDIFSRPIGSVPGATVKVLSRKSNDNFWTLRLDREDPGKECVNLASYNYLGFAENDGPCTNAAIASIDSYGLSNCSSRHELGTLAVNRYGLAYRVAAARLKRTLLSFSGNWSKRWLNFWALRTPWLSAWALPPTRSTCLVWSRRAVWC
jgi:hypothetical protein